MRLTQVGPAALLARGASLRLAAPLRRGSGLPALIPATRALADRTACETTMPSSVDVVVVIVDARGGGVPSAGPRILSTGATLTAPLVAAGGQRLHLVYAVHDRSEPLLRIAVAAEQWQTTAVMGLPGRAEEWAEMLGTVAPRQLVPDGPLSATGAVSIQFESTTVAA
jgi:hypothetical protein